jgi:hypothetical protein
MVFKDIHQVKVTVFFVNFCHGIGNYHRETVLGAVTLTALGKTAMAMSHQLMRTRTGDTLD